MRRSVTAHSLNECGKNYKKTYVKLEHGKSVLIMLRYSSKSPVVSLVITDCQIKKKEVYSNSICLVKDDFYTKFKSKILQNLIGFISDSHAERYYIRYNTTTIGSIKINKHKSSLRMSCVGNFNWITEDYLEPHMKPLYNVDIMSEILHSIGLSDKEVNTQVSRMYSGAESTKIEILS